MSDQSKMREIVRRLIGKGMAPEDAAVEAAGILALAGGGGESPEAAYQRYLQSEEADPTGAYSEGGLTAGGIFGTGTVDFTDHDASSRRRNIESRSAMAGAAASVATARALAEQNEMARLKLEQEQLRLQLAEQNRRIAQLTSGSSGAWDDPGPRGKRRRHR